MTDADPESYNRRPVETPSAQRGIRTWVARAEAETLWLGDAIGKAAQPGDMICLIGDLGAGKTTFTKGIGLGLGLSEFSITSPSFSLIAEHRGGRIPLYHLDVYRLNSPDGLHDLGFDDYLRIADGLIVIEWADLVAEALPKDRLIVSLSPDTDPDGRHICSQEAGPSSSRLLEAIP